MPVMSKQNDHGTQPAGAGLAPAPQALIVNPPPTQKDDPAFYRILIAGLVAAILITICGIIALAVIGRPVPEGLVAIGSACAGGLVGLLVPSPVS